MLAGCSTVGRIFPAAAPAPATAGAPVLNLPWGSTPDQVAAARKAAAETAQKPAPASAPAPAVNPAVDPAAGAAGVDPAARRAARSGVVAAVPAPAPPPLQSLVSARPGVAIDPGYRIGPEDGLEVTVWKDESLKSTVLVRPDGAISFPLIGEVPVAGKTTTQVRAEIAVRLAKFVPDPEVTVNVVRVASYRIYVTGRVNKPGDFVLGRPVDVLQAISLAGGLTPFAEEDSIRIIRRVDGQQISIPFDYKRMRKTGQLDQNITLSSGDVLLVP